MGDALSINFVKYVNKIKIDSQSATITHQVNLITEEANWASEYYHSALNIRFGTRSYIFSLENGDQHGFSCRDETSTISCQIINTRNSDHSTTAQLFDKIALTEKETIVLGALKIIEPRIEKIAFVGDHSAERIAILRLTDTAKLLPLNSMGDGISRVFRIILALVNCENGFLLIDSFEQGLHYTVLEKLWQIIFSVAIKLNIQVFATTQSADCLAGFEKILNTPQFYSEGQFIRLETINGKVKPVRFDGSELEIATEHNIETR